MESNRSKFIAKKSNKLKQIKGNVPKFNSSPLLRYNKKGEIIDKTYFLTKKSVDLLLSIFK